MLQTKYKSKKLFHLRRKHLLMLAQLSTINEKKFFSIFIEAPDKHTIQSKVDKIINNKDNPSKALDKLIESIGDLILQNSLQ